MTCSYRTSALICPNPYPPGFFSECYHRHIDWDGHLERAQSGRMLEFGFCRDCKKEVWRE